MERNPSYFKTNDEAIRDYKIKLRRAINLAKTARRSGRDPVNFIESQFVISDYQRISTIVGLKGIDKRLKELARKTKNRYLLAYRIAEEIVLGKFAFLDDEASLLLALRTAIAVLTKGIKYHYVTQITKIKLKRNGDATIYPAIIMANNSFYPLTLLLFSIVILDKLRRTLGLERWKIETFPQEKILAIARDFYSQTSQQKPPFKEIIDLLKKIPIEVCETHNGKETLSKHFINLVTNLNTKLSLFLLFLKKTFNLEEWKWVDEIQKLENPSLQEKKNVILISPNNVKGFRVIYDSNFPKNVVGLHPSIYTLLEGKIDYGTKLYVNGKGPYGISYIENLSPPFVKYKDGSVDYFLGERNKKDDIEEILSLGDLLLHGKENNVYTEEKWLKELKAKSPDKFFEFIKNRKSFSDIKEVSEKYKIPLHPFYAFYLQLLSVSEILTLRSSIKSFIKENSQLILQKNAKTLLEKALIPFTQIGDEISVTGDIAQALMFLLKPEKKLTETPTSSLDLLSRLSGISIPNKISSFASLSFEIEIKKEKEKIERPHVIFPLGDYYHVSHDILDHEVIHTDLANLYCEECSIFTLYKKCPKCGKPTRIMYFCEHCRKLTTKEICEDCGSKTKPNYLKGIKILNEIQLNSNLIGLKPLKPLIGIEELKSYVKIPESLAKGIIRQYHALTVDRDATIRYSTYLCSLTITQAFRFNTNIEKLKSIGYKKDIFGNQLTSESQIIQLKPFDILIPKEMAKLFLKVSKYIDELLKRLYGLNEFYRIDTPEELLGHLLLVIPEGFNTGIVLRIVGFTNDKVTYIHPSFFKKFKVHPGIQKGFFTLLLDTLLNFSKYYIEQNSDNFPHFIQPVLGIKAENETLYISHINLKRGLTEERNFKDSYEALQLQLSLIRKIKGLNERKALNYITEKIIVKNLFDFVIRSTTGEFMCSGCGAVLRRIPLSKRCPICKKEVKPLDPPSSLSKHLYSLRNLVDRLEDQDIKEKLMLVIENVDMLTRVKKQATITDFF